MHFNYEKKLFLDYRFSRNALFNFENKFTALDSPTVRAASEHFAFHQCICFQNYKKSCFFLGGPDTGTKCYIVVGMFTGFSKCLKVDVFKYLPVVQHAFPPALLPVVDVDFPSNELSSLILSQRRCDVCTLLTFIYSCMHNNLKHSSVSVHAGYFKCTRPFALAWCIPKNTIWQEPVIRFVRIKVCRSTRYVSFRRGLKINLAKPWIYGRITIPRQTVSELIMALAKLWALLLRLMFSSSRPKLFGYLAYYAGSPGMILGGVRFVSTS